MKLAFYIGDHSNDSLVTRLGWYLTQLVQKGPYGNVTHVEAIHYEYPDGSTLIASSSVRDGGVRSKQVRLDPTHWMIVDVPQWKAKLSSDLLQRTRGQPYDWRGAAATCLPGRENGSSWFCNEWVSFPYLKSASNFGPHQLAAICLSIGTDVTTKFFNSASMPK
jgi:hypothetical protein